MKLSNESPVGKALLGRKRGEEVVFSTPKGERKLKITKIDVASSERVSRRAGLRSDVFAARRQKLDALRAAGVEPFPHEFDGVEPIAAVRDGARGARRPARRPTCRHRVAGRLAARRGQGKMAFLDLVDRSGRIQLQARVDELGAGGDGRGCWSSISAT